MSPCFTNETTSLRADSGRMKSPSGVELEQPVLELAQLEEVVLLLQQLERLRVDRADLQPLERARAVDDLGLGLELLAARRSTAPRTRPRRCSRGRRCACTNACTRSSWRACVVRMKSSFATSRVFSIGNHDSPTSRSTHSCGRRRRSQPRRASSSGRAHRCPSASRCRHRPGGATARGCPPPRSYTRGRCEARRSGSRSAS